MAADPFFRPAIRGGAAGGNADRGGAAEVDRYGVVGSGAGSLLRHSLGNVAAWQTGRYDRRSERFPSFLESRLDSIRKLYFVCSHHYLVIADFAHTLECANGAEKGSRLSLLIAKMPIAAKNA